jgi:hypothetical protein
MNMVCMLNLFRNFWAIDWMATLIRPHWFFDRGHGFGAGGFLILVLIILLIFFGIRALTGEGKSS